MVMELIPVMESVEIQLGRVKSEIVVSCNPRNVR